MKRQKHSNVRIDRMAFGKPNRSVEMADRSTPVSTVMVTIRRGTQADLYGLLQLQAACWPKEWHDTAGYIAQQLRRAVVVVAIERTAIIGASIIQCHDRRMQLYAIEIHPNFRRHGLGRCLTLESIRLARARWGQLEITARPVTVAGAALLAGLIRAE